MNRCTRLLLATTVVLSGGGFISDPALAVLTMTAAGSADGFSLSAFVDQVPATGFCCGPLGMATNSAGQVVMQVFGVNNFLFADVDNQHFSANLGGASPAVTVLGYALGITNSGGKLYAGDNDASGQLVALTNSGASAGALPGSGIKIAGHGIATNQVNGHLVSATATGIYDTDSATGVSTLIVTVAGVDGVAVSGALSG